MRTTFLVLVALLTISTGAWYALRASAMGTKKVESAASSVQPKASDRVWVVRADGAQSCGVKEGESVEAGDETLRKEGIPTFGAIKGNDGLMHMQVCGAPKGSLNGYLIDSKDLARALALGFKEAPKGFGARSSGK